MVYLSFMDSIWIWLWFYRILQDLNRQGSISAHAHLAGWVGRWDPFPGSIPSLPLLLSIS